MDKIYDVTILGAGPSGLVAGAYAGRARLDMLLIEKGKDGGRIAITDEIENCPGQMVDGESSPSPIERMTKQVEKFGAERVYDTIVSVDIEGPVKTLVGSNGIYKACTLIIATDVFPRPIGCKDEGEFMGKNASHCATCDASFFEDLEVFVVGGGDSAVEEAMYLTEFARRVTVIRRRDELCVAKSIQERTFKNPKLFFIWDTAVKELHGDGTPSGMAVRNVKTGELTRIDVDEDDGLFGILGFIGYNPRGELFEGKLEVDRGYIKIDEGMYTNVEGAYAAGDIRAKSLRRVVIVAADGAVAPMQVEKWFAEQKQVIHSWEREVIPVVDLTKDNLREEVLKTEGTVLVDFYGDGYVPYTALMPHIHAMEGDYGDKIKFTSLNTIKACRLAIGQKILGLPVIVIYKGGEEAAECVKDDATVEDIKVMIGANL